MPDDKRGRESQARGADDRQRQRDVLAELEQWDDAEPPVETAELGDLEAELEAVEFPATGSDIVATVGDRQLEAEDTTFAVADLVPDTDAEVFDDPETFKTRVQRPTVAASMKRIVETAVADQNLDLRRSQREAYEKTLRALRAIDADDDDEGVAVITDWILEQIAEKDKLPGSRGVRRQAAKFCRANGYEVSVDDWLGI